MNCSVARKEFAKPQSRDAATSDSKRFAPWRLRGFAISLRPTAREASS
jgi:hypothetical protein